MKRFLSIMAVVVAVALSGVNQAMAADGSLTNTSAETHSHANQIMDQSTYAGQNSRQGLIVGHWNVTRFGGTNALLGITLPDGSIFDNKSLIDITVAWTPAGVTGTVCWVATTDSVTSVATVYRPTASPSVSMVAPTNIGLTKLTEEAELAIQFDSTTAPTQAAMTIMIPYWVGNR
jgi:hypothetical protein